MLDPGNSTPNFFGGAGNASLLHTDANINGTGILVFRRQPSFPPFLGNNALQLTNSVTTSTATNELDLVGLVTGDGSGCSRAEWLTMIKMARLARSGTRPLPAFFRRTTITRGALPAL